MPQPANFAGPAAAVGHHFEQHGHAMEHHGAHVVGLALGSADFHGNMTHKALDFRCKESVTVSARRGS